MALINKDPLEIQAMFDSIAAVYDKNNEAMSLGMQKKIKRAALQELYLGDNMRILDVCTGTGDIPVLINQKNSKVRITGIDFSLKMLDTAKEKSPETSFIQADAEAMPFPDKTFDIVTMSFGLRNIRDYKKTICECRRVLKAGGELMHLDFGERKLPSVMFDKMTDAVIRMQKCDRIPYRYMIESKKEFPPPEKLVKGFEEAGFKLKKRKDFLFGIISMQIFEKCNILTKSDNNLQEKEL